MGSLGRFSSFATRISRSTGPSCANISSIVASRSPTFSLKTFHTKLSASLMKSKDQNSFQNSGHHGSIPAVMRTIPIHSLLITNIFTGRLYWLSVESSCIFIMKDASPAISITSLSGCQSAHPWLLEGHIPWCQDRRSHPAVGLIKSKYCAATSGADPLLLKQKHPYL